MVDGMSAPGRAEGRGRSLEDLAFIRDRVLAEIRANPGQRPYLGEEAPKRKTGPKPTTDAATLEARRRRRADYKRRWREQQEPRS